MGALGQISEAGQPFAHGDRVLLKRALEGASAWGTVVGWYVNHPGWVVVRFSSGDTREVPTEALDRAGDRLP